MNVPVAAVRQRYDKMYKEWPMDAWFDLRLKTSFPTLSSLTLANK